MLDIVASATAAVRKAMAESERVESRVLDTEERRVLASIGANLDYPPTKVEEAFRRSRIRHDLELAKLQDESLNFDQVRDQLCLTQKEFQQLLATRKIICFGVGSQRWFPVFQFREGGGLLPGFEEVSPHIRESASPVHVAVLFETPSIDLVFEGEKLSIVEWLSRGLPVQEVKLLAEEI
ncbi:hypothetical protein [Parahaliea aestuarii]|uniref:Uncharacterized protein n=1 Tax=Parahaliea aestuarii TaxID=1852021 RepID=A0A5C8ZN79_9GAMM|nr:hypothetical protein [Parahaliea aestuarii]TXS89214.1 hypothetical protein FVW59_19015 [Parahaliea aestuarii]